MLGKGEWHRHVPRTLKENLLFRRWLLKKCAEDDKIKRAVIEACRQDILFYINSFVFQFNPDDVGFEVDPFITHPFQEDAILGFHGERDGQWEDVWGILECADDQEDARWPKSRKMGASWVMLMTMDWVGLFHKNKIMSVLSRDEDSIDQRDDPNSLFWKIEFMHDHLPEWLLGNVEKKSNRFIYRDTRSYIVGEANTPSAFVGGRAYLMLVDEFGRFKNGAATFELTSDVAQCRIFVFTHSENSGMAYNLCFDAKYVSSMREIKTHWSLHPEYNRGLYRYDEESNSVVVIDKKFDFDAICHHCVSMELECNSCGQKRKPFEFVRESKPTGGPHPGLRSPWYDKQCRRRSERDVAMNLDIDPRGATDKFFDAYRIQVLRAKHASNPLWQGSLKYDKATGEPYELVKDDAGFIKLWVQPSGPARLPDMRAVAAVDISAGTGYSPSCLSIFSADSGIKVVEYANSNIFQIDFAVLVAAICRMIRSDRGEHPALAWEIQGGAVFERRIKEINYSPLYLARNENIPGRPVTSSGRPGWNASPQGIKAIMERYRDALYSGSVINKSEFALLECLNFVYTVGGVEYKGSKKKRHVEDDVSGAKIHHGDIVRADALAVEVIRDIGLPGREEKTDKWVHPRSLAGRIQVWKEWDKESREAELVWA